MEQHFEAVRCPVCRAILMERLGNGTSIKKKCRCRRMILIDSTGRTSVLEESSAPSRSLEYASIH